MDIKCWHYDNWVCWRQRVFGKTISSESLLQNGKVFQAATFYQIDMDGDVIEYMPPEREDTFYSMLIKDNQQYLLPQKYMDQLPVMIKKDEEGNPKVIDVKIKKADKDFWKYITGVTSYSVPPKRCLTLRKTIDHFNELKSSDPMVGTFHKFVAFSRGLKLAICGNTGSGKNGNFTVMEYALGEIVPDLVPCSKAVFYKYIKFNHHINLDELTSWKAAEMQLIEDDIKQFGAVNPKQKKSSLNAKGQLDDVDIRSKGLTFTFNPLTKDNPAPFHSIFSNYDKIKDRFPILLLPYSKIVTYIEKPSPAESEAIVESNFDRYNKWAQNIQYYYFNMDKEMHGYDQSKSPFNSNIRFTANAMPLLRTIDAYCNDQAEFDMWMDWLKKCMHDYKKMLKDNGVDYKKHEETTPEIKQEELK